MGAMRYLEAICFIIASSVSYAQLQPPASGTGELSKARVFTPEQGTVRIMANGSESRDILHAALATGEVVSMHESRRSQEPSQTRPTVSSTPSSSSCVKASWPSNTMASPNKLGQAAFST